MLVDEGRVLVGRRIAKQGDGKWALPGGWVEHGESIEACGARELLEETGLGAADLAGPVRAMDVAPCVNSFADGSQSVSVFVVARLGAAKPEPKLCEPDKCSGWRWARFDGEPWLRREDMFPSLAHVLGSVAARRIVHHSEQ